MPMTVYIAAIEYSGRMCEKEDGRVGERLNRIVGRSSDRMIVIKVYARYITSVHLCTI